MDLSKLAGWYSRMRSTSAGLGFADAVLCYGYSTMDPVLIVLLGLLLATLLAFLLGIFPYPFGLLVLSAFIAARLFYLRDRNKRER